MVRFRPFYTDDDMSRDDHGPYVLYTEAAKLESENAALRAEVEALRKLCGEAAAVIDNVSPGEDILIDRLARAAKGEP